MIACLWPCRYFSINDIDDYYKKKDPKPLIFCHFARGLAEKMYDEVPDYASLYKTLMEALNGEWGGDDTAAVPGCIEAKRSWEL